MRLVLLHLASMHKVPAKDRELAITLIDFLHHRRQILRGQLGDVETRCLL